MDHVRFPAVSSCPTSRAGTPTVAPHDSLAKENLSRHCIVKTEIFATAASIYRASHPQRLTAISPSCYSDSNAVPYGDTSRVFGTPDRLSSDIATINPALAAEGARLVEAMLDPREPDNSRSGIFRNHNCWKCRSGEKPCAQGNPNRCEFPVARNH